MKTVSEAYKESMAQPLRNRSYAQIIFDNVNTRASSGGYSTMAGGETDYSEEETIWYDFAYGRTIATLEHNRWALDGNTQVLPDEDTIVRDGVVGAEISSDTSEYTVRPVFTHYFTEPAEVIGFTIGFDEMLIEYPARAYVVVEDAVTSWLFEIKPKAPVVALEIPNLRNVTRFAIQIWDSGLPGRRVRIKKVLCGMVDVYGNNEIVSLRQTHDIDPLSRRLPKEEFVFTVLDPEQHFNPEDDSGFYDVTNGGAPVTVQYGYELDDGTIEWLKADRYVINGKPAMKNRQVTFTALGLIGSMSDIYYKSQLGEKSFYDMAVAVLQDANLKPTPTGNDPWDVDESLKNLYTTACLPVDTHMNCLQLIAQACGCQLYSDDDNVIHIRPFSAVLQPTDFTLTQDSVLEDSSDVTRVDKLRQVTVAKYAYTPNDTDSTLYEETTDKTSLHAEFSSPATDVSIIVDGASVLESVVYAQAVDLTLTEGTKTVTITGKTLSQSSTILSFDYGTEGEQDPEQNPLITSDAMAEALAAHVAAYLQYRNTYTVDYRGNPELETRDVIHLETQFSQEKGETIPALVLTDEIRFDGALSGSLTLKGLV